MELVTAYTTDLSRGGIFVSAAQQLPIGASVQLSLELPDGATVTSATLNGSPVEPKLAQTTRGLEAVISAPPEQGTATLVIIAD